MNYKVWLRRIFIHFAFIITIVGSAVFVVQDYNKITNIAFQQPYHYFSSWQFADALIRSSNYIDQYDFENDENNENIPWGWEYDATILLEELDFYSTDSEGEVYTRDGYLLEQIINEPISENLKTELENDYQAYLTLDFDESGNVHILNSYGIQNDQLSNRLEQSINSNYHYSDNTTSPKNLTVVVGIPKIINPYSDLMKEIIYYSEDNYIFATIPYVILTVSIAALVTLLIPFSWVMESRAYKFLCKTPLEFRAMFLIATGFAVCFSPLLVISTEAGYLTEAFNLMVASEYVEGLVFLVNAIAWSGLAYVSIIHMLFLKQFFVEGPKSTIINHSIFGWIIKGIKSVVTPTERYPKETVETIKTQFIPLDLNPLLSNLETLEKQIAMTELDSSTEKLDLTQETINQMKNWIYDHSQITIDLNVVIEQFVAEENVNNLTLRFKPYFDSIKVITSPSKLMQTLNLLVTQLETISLPDSRLYIEIEKTENKPTIQLRSILKDDEALIEMNEIKTILVEQSIQLETNTDGDLLKVTLTFEN